MVPTQASLTPKPCTCLYSASCGSRCAHQCPPSVLAPPALASWPSEFLYTFLAHPGSYLGSPQLHPKFHSHWATGRPSLAQAPERSILSAVHITVPTVHPRLWKLHHYVTLLNPSQYPEKVKQVCPNLRHWSSKGWRQSHYRSCRLFSGDSSILPQELHYFPHYSLAHSRSLINSCWWTHRDPILSTMTLPFVVIFISEKIFKFSKNICSTMVTSTLQIPVV